MAIRAALTAIVCSIDKEIRSEGARDINCCAIVASFRGTSKAGETACCAIVANKICQVTILMRRAGIDTRATAQKIGYSIKTLAGLADCKTGASRADWVTNNTFSSQVIGKLAWIAIRCTGIDTDLHVIFGSIS